MKTFMLIIGIIFWVGGVLGLVFTFGEVFSRRPETISLNQFWTPAGIHFIIMALGAGFISLAVKKKEVVEKE